MRVLLTGANGFIGSCIARALTARGHQVVCAVRRPPKVLDHGMCSTTVLADLTTDVQEQVWIPRLANIDAVVNAAGILRERGTQRFDTLHTAAPRALFAACTKAGVKKVIQISALGADSGAVSRYHLSKKAADEYLLELPLATVVVQPSLIYGPRGTSARLFNQLASLPLIPLPGGGGQWVQPIHVDDAVEAIVALLQGEMFLGKRVALVGPRPITLRQFLSELRQAMGLGPARFLPVPSKLVALSADIGTHLPGSLLDTETLGMLERGNTAEAIQVRALLGREPRPVIDFIPASHRAGVKATAQLTWLLPILRFSIALMWIVTGMLSLGLYPVSASYALLARVGVPDSWAPSMLYGAALLDLGLGFAVYLMHRRRALWFAQMALIIGYTAIITWRLTESWLHPFGPILKNIPILALLGLLAVMEED